jgi:predicted RNase H-like HicB family nuclease
MNYHIVLEETATGYSAYSPDLPGCIATGRDRAEVEQSMREALQFHIEGLQAAGEPIPQPKSTF